jgi:RND family efflux transporter MFP subunit
MNDTHTTEEQLRAEIANLRKQLESLQRQAATAAAPSMRTFVGLLFILAALLLAGYFLGYLPRQRREQVLAAEAQAHVSSLPAVNVEPVERSSPEVHLSLPGNIQAITEAPILARASGYIRKRYVDIGDRVRAGEVLAEIEAPEIDQQIKQARAAIDQANSNVQEAEAALRQGEANADLAKLNASRYANLLAKGVVSKQENDNYQAQFQAQQANVQALEKAVAAARSNAAAAEANLARLRELQGYQMVRAPFDGVITLRNIDSGALVNEGNTLLFRIAQTEKLRIYVNVPQGDAESIRRGQTAVLTIPNLPGRKFTAAVARTANALDPSTRTLLVDLEVPNRSGALLPGMYAQVDLSIPRPNPPLLIPSDTLVVRSDGPQVAVVDADGTVHFARVQLGRDFGDSLEVLAGLKEGQRLVVNPSDAVREGVRVKPMQVARKGSRK